MAENQPDRPARSALGGVASRRRRAWPAAERGRGQPPGTRCRVPLRACLVVAGAGTWSWACSARVVQKGGKAHPWEVCSAKLNQKGSESPQEEKPLVTATLHPTQCPGFWSSPEDTRIPPTQNLGS